MVGVYEFEIEALTLTYLKPRSCNAAGSIYLFLARLFPLSTIAMLVIRQHQDITFALVVVWALIAIVIRQIDTLPIFITGVLMAIVLIVASAISTY